MPQAVTLSRCRAPDRSRFERFDVFKSGSVGGSLKHPIAQLVAGDPTDRLEEGIKNPVQVTLFRLGGSQLFWRRWDLNPRISSLPRCMRAKRSHDL